MSQDPANARELFSTLLELPSDQERDALLDEVAAASPTLAENARELLQAHRDADAGGFFATNPRWPEAGSVAGDLPLRQGTPRLVNRKEGQWRRQGQADPGIRGACRREVRGSIR